MLQGEGRSKDQHTDFIGSEKLESDDRLRLGDKWEAMNETGQVKIGAFRPTGSFYPKAA